MNRGQTQTDAPTLWPIESEDADTEPLQPREQEDTSREVQAYRHNALYWRTRALAAESLGVKDNVLSALTALRAIIRMSREDYEEEGADNLLARIRHRAGTTVQAIEATRRSKE